MKFTQRVRFWFVEYSKNHVYGILFLIAILIFVTLMTLNVPYGSGVVVRGEVIGLAATKGNQYEHPYPVARTRLNGGKIIDLVIPRSVTVEAGETINVRRRPLLLSNMHVYKYEAKSQDL